MISKKTTGAKNKSIVSNLSVAFKRSVAPSGEEIMERKKNHRNHLDFLLEDFMSKVQSGEVEGIRNAKDLVEVIKMDLLLLGEVTERTEQTNAIDEVKLKRVISEIDEDDPAVKKFMDDIMFSLNKSNDNIDSLVEEE